MFTPRTSMSNSTQGTFDFQAFLQSDELAEWRDFTKITDIIFSVTGSVSFIGSSAIIWHILRSHQGLSSTYHRLVFGMCVGDLISSFAIAINSIAAPKELQYLMPFARGNMGTCSTQGFFLSASIAMTYFYNCSICFYYLSIITFNKKDEYIKRNLELWFHGVPVIFAIVTGITGLIMKQFNTNGEGQCYWYPTSYHPPHCRGVENGIITKGFTIPCGRGDTESGNLFRLIMNLLPLTIVPAIIVGTMVTMYITVRKIERKMLTYGVNALRLRASQQQVRVVDGIASVNAPGGRDYHTSLSICLYTLKSKLAAGICSTCLVWNHPSPRSNSARSQKRAVLYMAMSYSLTWALTWIPFFILFFAVRNKATNVLQAILQPLQGFYNLIVYMSPKVRNARNKKRGILPWRQAIAKAWMSKGEMGRAISKRRHTKTASMVRQRL